MDKNIIFKTYKEYNKLSKNFIINNLIDSDKPFQLSFIMSYIKIINNNFDEFFDSSKIPDWLFTRNKQFSIPSIEYKAIDLVEQAFEHTRQYKLALIDRITKSEVYEADKEQVFKFGLFKIPSFRTINLNNMYIAANSIFSVPATTLDTISFHQAVDLMPGDKSSCFPHYTKKSDEETIKVTEQHYNKYYKILSEEGIIEGFKYLLKFPVTVFHRFQTKLKRNRNGKIVKDVKIRQVWGNPYLVSIIEMSLFHKAIDFLSRRYFYSYRLTRPQISIQVSKLRQRARLQGRKVICGDIKSIDSSHPIFSIYLLFSICARITNLTALQRRSSIALFLYHCFTPVTWTSRRLSFTNGGNKSGSSFTSIINSVYMEFIITYHFLQEYKRLPEKDELFILGDDFILIGNEQDLAKLKKTYKVFNLTLSAKKTDVVDPTGDILYLGFYWDIYNEPHQKDLWWIAKICFPERYVDDVGYGRILTRVASIVFQLRDGHQIFKKLCINQLSQVYERLDKYKDFVVKFYDRSSNIILTKIPLSELLNKGWRIF